MEQYYGGGSNPRVYASFKLRGLLHPPQHTFNSIQPDGRFEMTMEAGD
ncbi:MAG: hypothetical protein KF862_08580 [Chitinophagaceae bacterium]|nr:hypothetical protein [Chitinophagaceae bacterium]